MDAEQYARLKPLFLELSGRPADERAERLQELPAADREALSRLLSSHDNTSAGLDTPPAPLEAARALPGRIGPYRIVDRLGAGGMGEVFLAEQEGELQRQVALKCIRGAGEFRARFEDERRLLSRLQHPAIAQVHEAGEDPEHGAWFAMEFVDGPPVDEWARGATLPERVAVVAEICDGIAHAHQRGILHRDLKPANLLVATVDGRPRPKIIDFGVAKALQLDPALPAGRTVAGQLLGTPEYMSPEQAELQPELVDTRSDVYSIGVVLYELLCGELPLGSDRLRGIRVSELRERLLNDTPPAPSARATGVDRELDWVCARALAKDPDERYASAGALADELRRWLDGKALEAGPPTLAYRGRKFVARHRGAVLAAGLVLGALLLGLAGTTIGLQRARQAEAQAVAEARRAQEISGFLVGLFEDADPTLGGRRDEVAEWVLSRGDEALAELADEAARTAISATMGRVYNTLGLHDDARRLLLAARGGIGADAAPEERARLELAWGANQFGRGEPAAADSSFARGLRALGGRGPALLRADLWSWRGSARLRAGDYELALGHIQRADSLYRSIEPLPWRQLADNLRNLGVQQRRSDQAEAALATSDEALALLREQGQGDHPVAAAALHSRANALEELGRYEESLADFAASRAIWVRSFGEVHPHVASSHSSESVTLYRMGRYEDMEEAASRALAIQEQLSGQDHPAVAQHLTNRSVARLSRGELDGVEDDLLRCERIYRAAYGDDHPNVAATLDNLAYLYQEQGRDDDALRAARECARIRRASLGEAHRSTLVAELKLAEQLDRMGERSEASRIAREALPKLEAARGPEHDHTVRARALAER